MEIVELLGGFQPWTLQSFPYKIAWIALGLDWHHRGEFWVTSRDYRGTKLGFYEAKMSAKAVPPQGTHFCNSPITLGSRYIVHGGKISSSILVAQCQIVAFLIHAIHAAYFWCGCLWAVPLVVIMSGLIQRYGIAIILWLTRFTLWDNSNISQNLHA